MAAAVVALVAGCGPATTPTATSGSVRPTAATTTTGTDGSAGGAATATSVAPAAAAAPSTRAVGSTASQARPGTALALLGTLVVKGRGPMTGYTRAQFGQAWTDTDRNGCDQRNDVLRRDLRGIRLKAGTHGCVVLSGTLLDPYTGRTIAFTRGPGTSAAVQIDHVVPLADAWVKGAARWDVGTRTTFANDPLNLLAVSGPVNAAKGAGDAATWLPPAKGFRCAYAARQVAVKARYAVAVTSAERAALARILGTCPTTPVPTAGPVALGGWPVATSSSTSTPRPTTATGTSSPKPSTTSTSSVVQGVHPGAFCSPESSLGRTSAGTLMRCSTTATDPRARWRRA
ncbi:HNH endonuclease family protein [Phycicoccus sp. M110.8]|uniref:HNH endonuclease family protein n=1 Tax=Phycicoccus sp. M110.8 TaxID=3075433 RepID=UPI0028FD6A1E|nr:HNH endonuclease family protein [Phycicoccus sp. M110.8]MDU0315182.1 HNH endonuclease family protein [Phycicoccus sp. M110.8]